MTPDDFNSILSKIEYRRPGREKWKLIVRYDHFRPYMQVVSTGGVDSDTGKDLNWTGRKWWLSEYMCVTEVVRTAFKAIQAAEEHETCENFRYKGCVIFSPHRSVDALAAAALPLDSIDTRDRRTVKP